jgi:hypothetical protein
VFYLALPRFLISTVLASANESYGKSIPTPGQVAKDYRLVIPVVKREEAQPPQIQSGQILPNPLKGGIVNISILFFASSLSKSVFSLGASMPHSLLGPATP